MFNLDIKKESFADYSSKIISKKISCLISEIIEIPGIQRIRDDSKINDIIKYQLDFHKKNGRFNLLGVINIHYCTETDTNYLIDGQHRYEAVTILHNKHGHNPKIKIELVKVPKYEDLQENYRLINKNTPLPDLPPNTDINLIEKVFRNLEQKYPGMISNKPRPNRPHINFNRLQEALSLLKDKLNVKDSKGLLELVEEHNKTLSERNKDSFPDHKNISDSMWQKCKENIFYLGLYKFKEDDYCYKWVKDIYNHKTGKNLKTATKNRKKRIPKQVKTECWNNWMGEGARNGKCKCCGRIQLDILNFHAGHIISEKNGGLPESKNLIPICSSCNLSMGTENYQDYMKNHYSDNWEKIKQDFI